MLELHRSVRFRRVSHASLHVYKSVDRRLCIYTGFCTVFHQSGDIRAMSVRTWPDAQPGGRVQVACITIKVATMGIHQAEEIATGITVY